MRCYLINSIDAALYAQKLVKTLTELKVDIYTPTVESSINTDWFGGLSSIIPDVDFVIFIGSHRSIRSTHFRKEIELLLDSPKRLKFLPVAFANIDFKVLSSFSKKWTRDSGWFLESNTIEDGPSKALVIALNTFLTELKLNFINKQRSTPESVRTKLLDKQPLNEGKLILVGRGEVGKTSLVKRLVENTFYSNEPKTDGINISTWTIQINSENFRLNIWDFGGQEIMHATHQFFLTERSLYVLVLNGREGGEDTDAEYWLKHIETFGAESPVIVVQNKIGQHPFDLNYRGLKVKYPQIKAFIKTDCHDNIGIVDLQKMIEEIIEVMPEIRMFFPNDWLKVKIRLEEMEDEFIAHDRFTQICIEEGIDTESDQDTLEWILHCLGIVLNYRKDLRLRETSVLKPEWITQGIYSIINSIDLAEKYGELEISNLEKILPKERYPLDKHFFLLELMRKFSLCFAFPNDASRYLIPDLLGKEEPSQSQEYLPKECLNFEYQYGILPEGLVPRFIVRSHILSTNQQRWRSGVILAYEKCKAIVLCDTIERKITIRVKGKKPQTRREFLAIIRFDFDKINADFKDRLDIQSKVPLLEYPEFSVDYKKLVAFEEQGVKTFPEYIGQKVITVQVSELLNGVDVENQRGNQIETVATRRRVFFSYSHRDERLKDELETHLKLLQRQGIISAWHDRKILPGTEWDREIDTQLENAKIILLLVSADFLASNYCWDSEVKRAMQLHERGKAIVVPIILRSCDWQQAPFGKLQGVQKEMLPITLHTDRDLAWTEIVKGIRSIAEN